MFKDGLFWKEQRRVSVEPDRERNLNITLVIVACAILVLVWLAPTSAKSFSNIKTAWENLSRPFRRVQENLGHAVAGLARG